MDNIYIHVLAAAFFIVCIITVYKLTITQNLLTDREYELSESRKFLDVMRSNLDCSRRDYELINYRQESENKELSRCRKSVSEIQYKLLEASGREELLKEQISDLLERIELQEGVTLCKFEVFDKYKTFTQPLLFQYSATGSDTSLPEHIILSKARAELSKVLASRLQLKLVESNGDLGYRKDIQVKLIFKQLDYEI